MKTGQLMAFGEVITFFPFFFPNRTKHLNTLCGQNAHGRLR